MGKCTDTQAQQADIHTHTHSNADTMYRTQTLIVGMQVTTTTATTTRKNITTRRSDDAIRQLKITRINAFWMKHYHEYSIGVLFAMFNTAMRLQFYSALNKTIRGREKIVQYNKMKPRRKLTDPTQQALVYMDERKK